MPTVDVNGIDLYFEESGSGPALIFAHGGLSSVATTLLRVTDFSSAGFRVIAFDARGHGRSGYTRNPSDYDKAHRAADLLGLMDGLQVQRAHIVGTSMGAATALTAAVLWPDRIGRLVVRSAASGDPDDPVFRQLRLLRLLYRAVGVRLTTSIASRFVKPLQRERMRQIFSAQRRGAVVPVLEGILSDLGYPEGLATIRERVLLIGVEGDAMHPATAIRYLASQISNAESRVATTRTYWEDNPDELRRVIVEFLREP